MKNCAMDTDFSLVKLFNYFTDRVLCFAVFQQFPVCPGGFNYLFHEKYLKPTLTLPKGEGDLHTSAGSGRVMPIWVNASSYWRAR